MSGVFAPDNRFLEGLRLFNEGKYYECHESIEALWLRCPADDPNRNLYKGVIQAAAALYQFDRGILTGAKGLYETSLRYLMPYRPVALGLDVGKLVTQMKEALGCLESWDGQAELKRPLDKTPRLDYKETY